MNAYTDTDLINIIIKKINVVPTSILEDIIFILNDDLILELNNTITSGVSGYPVLLGKLNNENIVIKLANKSEASILSQLQGSDYVVKLLIIISGTELLKFDTKNLLQNFKIPISSIVPLVMEKLYPANFYVSYNNADDFTILSEYTIKLPDMVKPVKVKMTKELLENMIRCTKIINYLHLKNIYYNDIKQENFGFDKDFKLKIYDFGESRLIKSNQRGGHYNLYLPQNDIIALGRMFINMLTGTYVLAPGRLYDVTRFVLSDNNIDNMLDKIEIDTEVINIIKTLIFSYKTEYNKEMLRETVQKLETYGYRIGLLN